MSPRAPAMPDPSFLTIPELGRLLLLRRLTGRAQSEAILVQLGMHYQGRTNFHRQRPPGL